MYLKIFDQWFHLLINGVFINLSISSKKINNSLAIGLKKGYVPHNQ